MSSSAMFAKQCCIIRRLATHSSGSVPGVIEPVQKSGFSLDITRTASPSWQNVFIFFLSQRPEVHGCNPTGPYRAAHFLFQIFAFHFFVYRTNYQFILHPFCICILNRTLLLKVVCKGHCRQV
ncbi:hypothetical protein FKM82_030336 [Ascaphus truei]